MKLEWMMQVNFKREKCRLCGKDIPANTLYLRAVHEPDGVDQYGYDACNRCASQSVEPPPVVQL